MDYIFLSLTRVGEILVGILPPGAITIVLVFAVGGSVTAGYLLYTRKRYVTTYRDAVNSNIHMLREQLGEAEKIGHFGSFTWDFANPEYSLWSSEMYNLLETPIRSRPPTIDALIAMTHKLDQEFAREQWHTALKRSGQFSFTFRILTGSGRLKYMQVNGTTTLTANGALRYVKGVVHDVTHEAEVDRAKSEFVSLASHQLKTPLTSLRWTLEGLLNGVAGPLSPAQDKQVRSALLSSSRMIDMVNDLLNVSRIESETLTLHVEALSVCELAQSVYDEQAHRAQERKLHFTINCPAGMPSIQADKGLLRMIFQNLISNAIKYTPEGGTVTCEVELGSTIKEELFIRVADSGIGIPKADQDRVFEKLHRAANAEALVTDGTGLGLYIIKMICKKVGGDITFESVEGQGTTFFVSLPVVWGKGTAGGK